MTSREAPGQVSGQSELGGLSWGELLAALVEAHGTLTAVAWKLVGTHAGDDVASIERALRRLRTRGQRDGGRWGQRVLRVFGVPGAIEARVRWMGLYHSPFNDLPVAVCRDQLKLWDRPPIATSRARIWVHLGEAGIALRGRDRATAQGHLDRATRALAALDATYDDARLELALVTIYASRTPALLEDAERLLPGIAEPDRTCFAARIVDHRGYDLNKAGRYAEALALYETIAPDVHPFASYRRDAGRAYATWKLGRAEEAEAIVRGAIDHAGDGGHARLRAMGLIMLSKITGDPAGRVRARAIADRLDDRELAERSGVER